MLGVGGRGLFGVRKGGVCLMKSWNGGMFCSRPLKDEDEEDLVVGGGGRTGGLRTSGPSEDVDVVVVPIGGRLKWPVPALVGMAQPGVG